MPSFIIRIEFVKGCDSSLFFFVLLVVWGFDEKAAKILSEIDSSMTEGGGGGEKTLSAEVCLLSLCC